MKAVALTDNSSSGIISSHIYDITYVTDKIVSVETKQGNTLMSVKNFKLLSDDRKTTSRNNFFTRLFKGFKNYKG